MAILISTEKVSKTYHPKKADATEAVSDISLEITAGEAVVLKGPSGSGKTSLLSLIGCMTRPTSGRVMVAGEEVSRLPERFLTLIRRRTFGFVFQQYHLIPELSVRDNVMLPLYPESLSAAEMGRKVAVALADVELTGLEKRRVTELSGGQQQRVAIARALVNAPRVLIADEPTAHLDSRLSVALLERFALLKQAGLTLVIATHDPQVCEHPLIDRIIELHDGRLCQGTGT
ncbi:ABC transporter ATP-binding protein [Geopsychrobacter electrodiphilus]|uniref:ABC transporter ATP-binding protein n=1 Tax=Geopsychrobacter electrodiphilus TaxID=225196 RepID=UPI00036FAB8C|nr:ABC transporter ATP-binding protein [Geopsychrobacter electrodiphilus]